jgi:hypothetical protein
MNPEKIYEKLITQGELWAVAHAAAHQLEDQTKSILATTTIMAKETEQCSVSEAERIALMSAEYRDHLRHTIDARKVANIEKVRYEGIKTWIDMMRTKESNERAVHLAR